MPFKLPPLGEVLDLLPDAVCMVAPDGEILMVNAAFETIFGYPPAEAKGRQIMDLVHPEDRAATEQSALDAMEGRPRSNFRNRYIRKDGSVVDIQWSAKWLPDYGIRIGVGHEVTALRGIERQLEHLASHDALTGLPNRYHLRRELEAALERAGREGGGLALLYIDLDGFKAANDRYGHEAGDRLLRDAARQLRDGLRQNDLIARVGGDEFVAVLPACASASDALNIATALRARLALLQSLGSDTPQIDASVGVACFPADGNDADALLRHADAAMYVAKAKKRLANSAADRTSDPIS